MKKGLSMIELTIVLTIIGVLMASIFKIVSYVDNAQFTKEMANFRMFSQEIANYKLTHNNNMPQTVNGYLNFPNIKITSAYGEDKEIRAVRCNRTDSGYTVTGTGNFICLGLIDDKGNVVTEAMFACNFEDLDDRDIKSGKGREISGSGQAFLTADLNRCTKLKGKTAKYLITM